MIDSSGNFPSPHSTLSKKEGFTYIAATNLTQLTKSCTEMFEKNIWDREKCTVFDFG